MAVHLGRQKALRADARQPQHALQRGHRAALGAAGEAERLQVGGPALELEGLVGHLAQDLVEVEVDGGRRAGGRRAVDEADAAAAVDRADDLGGSVFDGGWWVAGVFAAGGSLGGELFRAVGFL